MKINRRRFLKAASGLLVPSYLQAGPGLPYFAGAPRKPVSASNGLLNGLAAYYKMDEGVASGTALDAIGSNNLTDMASNVSHSGTGIINDCRGGFKSASTNAALQHANAATFQIGAGVSFTVTGWYYVTQLAAGILMSKWDSIGTSNEYLLQAEDQGGGVIRLRFGVKTVSNAIVSVIGTRQIALSTWVFWAVGYNDSVGRVFLQWGDDGSNLDAKIELAADGVRSGTDKFTIGNYDDRNAPFPGLVDEIGFWRRALSQSELSTIWANRHGLPLSSFS